MAKATSTSSKEDTTIKLKTRDGREYSTSSRVEADHLIRTRGYAEINSKSTAGNNES